ncbi:MAG: phosphosulfolactate synthase [Paenibacillaceae bacterium]
MEYTVRAGWQPLLRDPSGQRQSKPRTVGRTMVIDKGMGLKAFDDFLAISSPYVDMVKLGFGTSPLYPLSILQRKIELAKDYQVIIYPGGTFLEVAVQHGEIDAYFDMVGTLGFSGIEVSDGTIQMSRELRNQLIMKGREMGLTVLSEYGKKLLGSKIEIKPLLSTIQQDVEYGADLVIVEGRDSGKGVGLYDEHGDCRGDTLDEIVHRLRKPDMLMWEAPLKNQQVQLLKTLGLQVNLGNIAAEEVYSLECLRRGLRSDTFVLN